MQTLQVSELSQKDVQRLDQIIEDIINEKMTDSLSMLVNDEVKFSLINTNEFRLDESSQMIPKSEFSENEVGIYITCDGDLKIGILFHMTLEDAKKIAAVLLESKSNVKLTIEGKSSLAEIGNIMAASLFNSINNKTECKIVSSVPGFAIETMEILLENPIIEASISNTFVYTYGVLECKNNNCKIFISIFQNPSNIKTMINQNNH